MRSGYVGKLVADMAGYSEDKPAVGQLQLLEYDEFGLLALSSRVVPVLNYTDDGYLAGTTVVVGTLPSGRFIMLWETD